MTPDPSAVIEALDYFEQEWQLNGRPYLWDAARAIKSRPIMAAAARSWVEGEEVEWCEVHRAIDVGWNFTEGTCMVAAWVRRAQTSSRGRIITEPKDCRIVAQRLCPSGLGE